MSIEPIHGQERSDGEDEGDDLVEVEGSEGEEGEEGEAGEATNDNVRNQTSSRQLNLSYEKGREAEEGD